MESAGFGNTSAQSREDDVGFGELVFLGITGLAMVLIGGIGNGVVVMLVGCSQSMRSPINLLLAVMALCDTFLMLLLLPLDLLTLVGHGWLLPTPLCYIHTFLLNVMQVESIVILTIIFVERYVIIVRREEPLTTTRASWAIVVSWIVSISVAVPPFFNVGSFFTPPLPLGLTHCTWHPSFSSPSGHLVYACVRFALGYLFPLIIMTFCFTKIIVKVKQNSSKIHSNAYETEADCLEEVNQVPEGGKREPKPIFHRRPLRTVDLYYKTRTFSTIMILFIVFVICRTPLQVTQLIHSFAYVYSVDYGAYSWLFWWFYIQPAISPIIYTARLKKFRDVLIEYNPWLFHLGSRYPSSSYYETDTSSVYMIHSPTTSTTAF